MTLEQWARHRGLLAFAWYGLMVAVSLTGGGTAYLIARKLYNRKESRWDVSAPS